MKLYLLAVALMGMSWYTTVTYHSYGEAFGVASLTVFGFAVVRTIWRLFNSGKVARVGGEFAAKIVNQADVFKDAFKDGRK